MKKKSYVTVTDQFCGAGGSSIGAVAAGGEVRLALNHWPLAIETHNANFPDTDHDCVDVSLCDPRRYPSTDILITSPECTNYSNAKGKKMHAQRDLFGDVQFDPAEERSRMTMWDVPRFAEVHDYDLIVVENVVQIRKWRLFAAWLHAMQLLDYQHKIVYFNSMFAWPTPQSRDRIYVVFWKKGNRPPDLEFRPLAHCVACGEDVNAVQAWKNLDKPMGQWGCYRRQYVYRCPACTAEVTPYYYCAFNVIDWSIPVERIGERKRPLRPKTIARIEKGLERFGGRMLVIPLDHTHSTGNRAKLPSDPLPTQTTRQTLGLVVPFLTSVNYFDERPRALTEPMPTQTTADKVGVTFQPFIVQLRNHQSASGLDDPLSTVTAGGVHHGLVVPAPFIVSYNGQAVLTSMEDALSTVVTRDRHGVVIPEPFLMGYYNPTTYRSILEDTVGVVTTVDHHAFVCPGEMPVVDDCGFRMLQPHEIGLAMAFPADYQIYGNKRQRVKQYGAAVTPPVMEMILRRCMDTLN